MRTLNPEQIAQRIRRRRLDAGYTVEQLAHRAGISKGAMSQWEGGGGGVRSYKAEHFLRLAHVLNVSPYWLMYGNEVNEHAGVADASAVYKTGITTRAQHVINNITSLATSQELTDSDMRFLQTAAEHIALIQRGK